MSLLYVLEPNGSTGCKTELKNAEIKLKLVLFLSYFITLKIIEGIDFV